MSTIQQQAALLHSQGFRLMPLRGSKGATVLGGFAAEHPDFTCGPEWFGDPDTVIGLLCGPCPALGEDWLLCVDLDGDFKNDPTIASFLEILPDTLTSHNGRHLFFRVGPCPERDRLAQWRDALGTKSDTGAALDLRWAGGYACERGDWREGTSLDAARDLVAPLPGAALAALLDANNGGRRPATEQERWRTDRHADPDVVPDPDTWDRLLAGWAACYPPPGSGGGRDICFGLGGLLARGVWTDELCELFVEQLLATVSDDPKHQRDGLTCAMLSLEKGPAAPGVYGIPKLVALLSPYLPAIDGAPPASTRVKMFLEGFLAAMQPAPRNAADLDVLAAVSAAAETGEDLDEDYLTWRGQLQTRRDGTFMASSFNVRWTLEHHPSWKGVFGYNELADRVSIRRPGPPDTRTDRVGHTWSSDGGSAFAIQGWFSRLITEIPKGMIQDGVKCVAAGNPFHPVREYLEGLPAWDGQDRSLVTYFGAEPSEYHREICALWLLAAIKRVYHPGILVKSVVIFESKQNDGKSTALRNLCADDSWFLNVRADVRNKDFLSNMRGKWIAEIAEIDYLLSGRDASELKDVLSAPVDTYRKSYDADERDHPRQLVFAGTTNRKDYLRDETGNVRFQPMACGSVDWQGVARDRDQIWAQTMVDFRAGKSHWLNHDLRQAAAAEAALRLEHDEWEDVITEQLDSGALSSTEQSGFTTAAALALLPGAIPLSQVDAKHTRRMAKVLRKLGFELKVLWQPGKGSIKRWVRGPAR